MTFQVKPDADNYHTLRSRKHGGSWRKWMRKRPPEVVLLHQMERMLESLVVRMRKIDVGRLKWPERESLKNKTKSFEKLYKKVVDLTLERVV